MALCFIHAIEAEHEYIKCSHASVGLGDFAQRFIPRAPSLLDVVAVGDDVFEVLTCLGLHLNAHFLLPSVCVHRAGT